MRRLDGWITGEELEAIVRGLVQTRTVRTFRDRMLLQCEVVQHVCAKYQVEPLVATEQVAPVFARLVAHV